MTNYHIPNKQESNAQRNRAIKTQQKALEELLFTKILDNIILSCENNWNFTPFDLETRENFIKEIILEYKKQKNLLIEEDTIYFNLLQRYDTLCNKAIKYHKKQEDINIKQDMMQNILDFSKQTEEMYVCAFGKNYNKQKKKRNGFTDFIIGLILKE